MSLHQQLYMLDVFVRRFMFVVFGAAFALTGWWLYTYHREGIVFGVSWFLASLGLDPVWTLVMGTPNGFTVVPYSRLIHFRHHPEPAWQWALEFVLPHLAWELTAIGLAVGVVWLMRHHQWRWLPRVYLTTLSIGVGAPASWISLALLFRALTGKIAAVSAYWINLIGLLLILLATLGICGLTWRWHDNPVVQMLVTAMAGGWALRLAIVGVPTALAATLEMWLLVGGSIGGALIQLVWYYQWHRQPHVTELV